MGQSSIAPALNQILLANAELQLVIRPDLGGRIDQLLDRKNGRNWLWHAPEYNPTQTRSLPIGTSFDDHWSGGWDEIFPNDVAGPFQGYHLADHGELWSQTWQVVAHSELSVQLRYVCETVPVQVEKAIELHPTLPQATITYWFENLSNAKLPFLFKQHAAIAIEPGDEILLPDCTIEPVDLGFSRVIGQAEKTRFPRAFDVSGAEINVQITPPRSAEGREFYYCSDLTRGECGIRHQRSGSSLVMQFDTADFPYVWMFQSYGGWRDFYVLVMEPCTTIPYDLEVACQNGTAAQIRAGETQRRRLTVSLVR